MSSPFSNPIAPGAPDPAPRPRDLEGCLVAYIPKAFTAAGAPGNDQPNGSIQPRDRVTADILLLDIPKVARGAHQPAPGVVYFGGSPDWDQDPKPHYLQVGAPAFFEGAWVNNMNIVRALAPNGQPLLGQMILGRIVRSTMGQKPFNLVAVDGTPDMALAIQLHSAIGMGQLGYQAPQPIPGVAQPQRQQQGANGAAPMPPANSVQYGAPPMPPQQPVEIAAMGSIGMYGGQYAGPHPPATPGVPVHPQAAVNQPWQDPAVSAVQAAFPGAQVVSQPVPGLYPGAPAMPGQVPPPPAAVPPPPPVAQPLHPALVAAGWTPENWASINDTQKQQVLATLPPQ